MPSRFPRPLLSGLSFRSTQVVIRHQSTRLVSIIRSVSIGTSSTNPQSHHGWCKFAHAPLQALLRQITYIAMIADLERSLQVCPMSSRSAPAIFGGFY